MRTFICHDCGGRYGTRQPEMTTWHKGVCAICGREATVTGARDYGVPERAVMMGRTLLISDEMRKEAV